MTTAPDLPLPTQVGPAAAPARHPVAPADPSRPSLSLVPTLPDLADDSSAPILDLEDALRRAAPRLHRYAVRRLHDPHEAEEVVQEALLRAFQHRETLRTEDDLMAWLTVVTGRMVIDRLRVRGRTTPVAELPPTARTGRDTAEVVVARDEARIALDALEAMPARQAAVLWAREVEGLSYDDISARFDISEPTVRSLLHRARRTLRREYAVRGGTLPSLGLVALAPWLRGLRHAARLRDVARRTGAAVGAVGATGLAAFTFSPLWSTPAPAPAQAAPMPAYVVKAQNEPVAPVAVRRPAVTARPVHHVVVAAAAPVVTTRHVQFRHLPVACTNDGVGAGCAAPTAPTLYVQLPGHRDIGVSTNLAPMDCAVLPMTPLTHCQPSDRNQS